MERLEDFTLVEPFFRGVGITPNWLHALTNGYTNVYNDSSILNWYLEDGICIINSGCLEGTTFSKSILRDIRKLIKEYKQVIISSEVSSIERFMCKYGFTYIEKNKVYIKGF